MDAKELAARLAAVRARAEPYGDKTVRTHLFAIEYAHELDGYSLGELKELARLAGAPPTMGTELQKCRKMARYVTVNEDARTR